jgi:hypothetical protein
LSIFKMYFFTTAETSRAMFVYQSERRPCTLRRCPAGCQRVLPSRNKVPSYLRRYLRRYLALQVLNKGLNNSKNI